LVGPRGLRSLGRFYGGVTPGRVVQQVHADPLFLGRSPVLLQVHNVGTPKPAESTMPRRGSEPAPVFFREHHVPKEGFILRAIAFHDHLGPMGI
jgi:hypothetical protein